MNLKKRKKKLEGDFFFFFSNSCASCAVKTKIPRWILFLTGNRSDCGLPCQLMLLHVGLAGNHRVETEETEHDVDGGIWSEVWSNFRLGGEESVWCWGSFAGWGVRVVAAVAGEHSTIGC